MALVRSNRPSCSQLCGPEGAYGRAILQAVQARLERAVAAGAVHTTLERREGKRLVSSRLGSGTPLTGGGGIAGGGGKKLAPSRRRRACSRRAIRQPSSFTTGV